MKREQEFYQEFVKGMSLEAIESLLFDPPAPPLNNELHQALIRRRNELQDALKDDGVEIDLFDPAIQGQWWKECVMKESYRYTPRTGLPPHKFIKIDDIEERWWRENDVKIDYDLPPRHSGERWLVDALLVILFGLVVGMVAGLVMS